MKSIVSTVSILSGVAHRRHAAIALPRVGLLSCLLASALLISGCGGGDGSTVSTIPDNGSGANAGFGSGGSNSATSGTSNATPTPVTAFLSKAPVSGATCRLYNSANHLLASATSQAGQLNFGSVSATSAMIVQCTGGSYLDEATGQTVPSITLASGISRPPAPSSSSSSSLNPASSLPTPEPIQLTITPLTQLAYARAAGDARQISTQAALVAKAFGLQDFNILSVQPTDLNTSAASANPQGRYGIVLASIAQYMKNKRLTLDQALAQMRSGITADGALKAPLAADLRQAAQDLGNPSRNANRAVQSNLAASNNLQAQVQERLLPAAAASVGSISINSIDPDSLIQGALGSSNWKLTGVNLTNSMVISLDGSPCISSGSASADGTQLTGVDCSNVNTSPTGSTASLSASIGSNTATFDFPLTPPPSPRWLYSVSPLTLEPGFGAFAVSVLSNSPGTITYSGDNETIARVSPTGLVTPLIPGFVTITADQAAVPGRFSSATTTLSLRVAGLSVPIISFAAPSKQVTLGDPDFTNAAIASCPAASGSDYTPTIRYGSNNSNVASVDASGKVIIKRAGNAVITANVSAQGNCRAGGSSYPLTINKARPVISFGIPRLEATLGQPTANFTQPATVSPPASNGSFALPPVDELTLSYSSSNEAVATVESTGLLTILSTGTATITAKVQGDANYLGSDDDPNIQASYALVVTASSGIVPPPATVRLTDTGITDSQCYGAGSDTLISCTSTQALTLSPTQDGMVGRDVTNPDSADGKLGFSYSGVPSGSLVSAIATFYPVTECVQDNITGLMWEGKPISGTRGSPALNPNGTYTNYANVGMATTYIDASITAVTNAQGYVNAVNAAGLCGFTDWRLPTADELQSIVDYGVGSPGPAVEANWFPNTQEDLYWTSSPNVGADSDDPWVVSFRYGSVNFISRLDGYYVRLVR